MLEKKWSATEQRDELEYQFATSSGIFLLPFESTYTYCHSQLNRCTLMPITLFLSRKLFK